MRIYKTKWFARFARRVRISDASLCEVVRDIRRGLIDADLGGEVLKQRLARLGAGKSGGYRVLIAYRSGALAVFIYGFAKSERDNIGESELATARDISQAWLNARPNELERAIKGGLIEEVDDDSSEQAP